jgi:hypothetical protein
MLELPRRFVAKLLLSQLHKHCFYICVQLKSVEISLENSVGQLKTAQQDIQKLKSENTRYQVQVQKLHEADEMLKESKEEIIAINVAKQATEDEKAILKGACDRCGCCCVISFVRMLVLRIICHLLMLK